MFKNLTSILFSEFYEIILIQISLSIIAIFWWRKGNLWKKLSSEYEGVQKIHIGIVPRVGGLLIYISLINFYINSNNVDQYFFLFAINVCVLPLILISSLEDFFHNVRPIFRFFSILISAFLLITYTKIELPSIDLPFINFFLQIDFIKYFFFILCIAALSNGMNIIDGTNGLLGFTALSQIFSIIFLASYVDDQNILLLCIAFLLPLITFLIFNFPFGKIFAGDTGAYFIGFFIGFIVILFFGRNPDLNSWNAVLILFYPIFEVIFSFFRKIHFKKSPFEPDSFHLHLKIFFYLEQKVKSKKIANNLTTIALSCIWILPTLILPFVYLNTITIFFGLLILSFLYLAMYLFIPSKKNITS